MTSERVKSLGTAICTNSSFASSKWILMKTVGGSCRSEVEEASCSCLPMSCTQRFPVDGTYCTRRSSSCRMYTNLASFSLRLLTISSKLGFLMGEEANPALESERSRSPYAPV